MTEVIFSLTDSSISVRFYKISFATIGSTYTFILGSWMLGGHKEVEPCCQTVQWPYAYGSCVMVWQCRNDWPLPLNLSAVGTLSPNKFQTFTLKNKVIVNVFAPQTMCKISSFMCTHYLILFGGGVIFEQKMNKTFFIQFCIYI